MLSMSFLGQLKKLINASIDEDALAGKDPAVVVRTLVRDMQHHLSGARTALNLMSRDERKLKTELVKLQKERGQWHKQAERALLKGDEPEARKCLRHKIAAKKCYDEIEGEYKKLAASCEKLRKAIGLLQRRLKETTAREKAILSKIRRIKRAEFLKSKFPMEKELAVKMAMEELDYDSERRVYASFLLEGDALDKKFQEVSSDDVLITDELTKIRKNLPRS